MRLTYICPIIYSFEFIPGCCDLTYFSGLIGRSWAMLFASVGYKTMLYDIVAEQVEGALKSTAQELKQLELNGVLRGQLNAEQQFACLSGTTDLKILLQNTFYIQECVPERLELKQAFYKQLDALLEPETIVASSTSTFLPSLLSETLRHRQNVSDILKSYRLSSQ